jgi:hypothetical protein
MVGITRVERERRQAEREVSLAATEQALAVSREAAEATIETPGGRVVTRHTRKPFGGRTQKLAYPTREGYHRHWFNDTPGRVAAALESGYTHVKDPISGKHMTAVVGVAAVGGALNAYLLEIPEEWWQDDMAAEEEINAAKEETIKRGVQAKEAPDADKFYPTAQGRRIQINNNQRR